MRAVIVTLLPPPNAARDRHGVYRRLRMFLHGIKDVCKEIEIVHFTRPEQTALAANASAKSSAFWGMPVTVTLVPLNLKPRVWWQFGSLAFSIHYRGDFRPYLGSDQASALRRVLDASPALIFAHRLPAMTALLQLPRLRSPIFFDLDDLEHRVKSRAARNATSPFAKMRNFIKIPALLDAERRSIARAARTFVCSAVDRTALSELKFDVSRTVVVPNATEIAELRPELSRSRSILYIGNYSYAPNAEAAERLIRRIWPKLRAAAESATLIIAGDHPERIPSFARRPLDVEFTGLVQDLEVIYARTRIVCCPISNGGGTRLKLIEAAGYGKPIVASSVAVEGLEFDHMRDVLVHDDDDEMALACAQLLQDDVLAEALAAAAHQKARSLYSVANVPGLIAQELRAGLAGHAAAKHPATEGGGARLRRQFGKVVQIPLTPGAKRENR
jgi:glycosyltransferase involved in cell wall biosynthesis